MIVIPKCLKCIHVRPGMKCPAYPNGIPSDILTGKKKLGEKCNESTIGYMEKEASE